MEQHEYDRAMSLYDRLHAFTSDEQRAALDEEPPGPGLDFARHMLGHTNGITPGNAEETDARTIGEYTIVRELQSGAMGEVFEARQHSPERPVAVKVLRRTIATPQQIRRFQREARIGARLSHPGIVRVYAVHAPDDTSGGMPYFASEWVEDAHSLTEFAQARDLSTRARIELCLQVCDSVAHAHVRGILHRDLKPQNILVGTDGRARVIDFGLALATMPGDPDTTITTGSSQVMGSLAYMSPEQAATTDVDSRTDIYALGMVLYELLSGTKPRPWGDTTLTTALQRIATEDPPAIRSIVKGLDSQLDLVVRMAIERDPSRRYQTVREFADDLRRFLNCQPISAHEPSRAYRLRTFCRRNRFFVFAGATVALALVTATVVSTVGMNRTAEAGRRARLAAYHGNIVGADSAFWNESTGPLKQRLDACPPEYRGWEWFYLHTASNSELRTVCELTRGIWDFRLSSDAKRMLTAGNDGVIRLFSFPDGRLVRAFEGHAEDSAVRAVHFTSDEQGLLSAGFDRKVRRWSLQDGRSSVLYEAPYPIEHLAMTESGYRAIALRATQVGLWAAGDDHPRLVEHQMKPEDPDQRVHFVAGSPDGQRIASAASDGTVRVWDAISGSERLRIDAHAADARIVEFWPGDRIATAGDDGVVRVWRGPQLEREFPHAGSDPVWSFVRSPNGRHLVTGAKSGFVSIWSLETDTLLERFRAHQTVVTKLMFSRDGSSIISASSEGTIKLLDSRPGAPGRACVVLPNRAQWATWGPSGLIIVSTDNHQAVLRSINDPTPLIVLEGVPDAVSHVTSSADGRLLALGTESGLVGLWSTESGRQIGLRRVHDRTMSVCFSADGTRLASSGTEGSIAIMDTQMLAVMVRHEVTTDSVPRIRFSHDDRRLVTGGQDEARIHDAATGELLVRFKEPVPTSRGLRSVSDAAFTRDDRHVLTISHDERVRLWNAQTGELVHTGHEDAAVQRFVELSPDGTRFVTGTNTGRIRVWDTESMAALITLRQRGANPFHASFSPDGHAFLVVDEAGIVTIWRDGQTRHP